MRHRRPCSACGLRARPTIPPSSFPNRTSASPTARCASKVTAVAEALAAAGVSRGDRVGMALPNGLPNIVSFLAASMAGTAAPLNPGYKEDEFRFYPRGHQRQGAAAAARRRRRGAPRGAAKGVRILTVDMDATGTRHALRRVAERQPVAAAVDRRRRADPAHQRQHRTAEARAAERTRTCRSRRATSRAATRSPPSDVSLCVMPLFHVHGLVASTLATLVHRRHGGRARQVQPAVVLADRARTTAPRGIRRCRRSTSCCWRASKTGAAEARRRREAALHPLVQRVAAAAGDARSRGRVRRAGARGLRHDRGRAPDGVESAAARHRTARLGRARHRTCRSASWTTRASICRPASAARSASRARTSITRLREQPRGQRHVVLRRLVPHRRPGLSRRGRLPDAGRAPEGDDQSRRREDLAARDRRGAARRIRRSPRRCASACRTRRGAKRWRPRSC